MMPVFLCGFIEGPERELDGQKADDERHRQFNEELRISGSLLDGVTTAA